MLKSHRPHFKDADTLYDIIIDRGIRETKQGEIIPIHIILDLTVIPLPFTNQPIMRQYDGYLKAYQIHCIHVSNIGFYSSLSGENGKKSTVKPLF